jgi:hypothetical protein
MDYLGEQSVRCEHCGQELTVYAGQDDVWCTACQRLTTAAPGAEAARVSVKRKKAWLTPGHLAALGFFCLLAIALVIVISESGERVPDRNDDGRVRSDEPPAKAANAATQRVVDANAKPGSGPAAAPAADAPPSAVQRSGSETGSAQWASALDRLANQFKLEVIWQAQGFPDSTPTGGLIEAAPATESDLSTAAPIVAAAIEEHYPPDFIARTSLRRLVMVGRLSANGRARHGHADAKTGTVYLDVGQRAEIAHTLHRELFQLVEHAVAKSPPVDSMTESLALALWRSINESRFSYTGEEPALDPTNPTSPEPSARPRGFVSASATSGIEVDRAETFAAMVTAADAVARIAADDPRVAAKVIHIMDMIDQFSPGAPPWKPELLATVRARILAGEGPDRQPGAAPSTSKDPTPRTPVKH